MERKYLTEKEVNQLLLFLKSQAKVPDLSFSTTRRIYYTMWAFVSICALAGLRSKEARNLRIKEINLGTKPSLYIRKSKNGESRRIPICNKAKVAIRAYLCYLEAEGHDLDDGERYLFLTRLSKKYTYQTLLKHFKLMCRRAGVEETATHACRHSFGFRLFNATKDLRLVGTMMGHRALSSTCIYAQPDPAKTRQIIDSVF